MRENIRVNDNLCITDQYDNNIDFSTAEKLYDYLASCMVEVEND
ncbi:hypothetical protein [Butyrivibrio sp. YAB3001]|nr:hypothetical protein [Butyrivibrio sp. YAB3001]SFC60076.1 hypothetical protein SAMN02910398_02648 [Butyrivibrio sp. YAB3001]